jgi:hypothetical protein
MRVTIINQYIADTLEDFEFRVNKQCIQLEKDYKIIVDVQFLSENKSLIAIIKYK